MGWGETLAKGLETGVKGIEAGANIAKRVVEGSVETAAAALSAEYGEADPNLKTTSPAETSVRTRLAFSDLILQFPTTGGPLNQYNLSNKRLVFPAYIQSFTDTFSPQWSPVQVFGRSDPIPVYKNTTRAISISVLIPCFDAIDANQNLRKLNTLIQNLYPGYERLSTGALVLDSPPLVRIKFANLIANQSNPNKGLLGYISNFQTDMGIKERGVFLGYEKLFPKAIGFTISFTPLHEHTVGFDSGQATGQFIGGDQYPYLTADLNNEIKITMDSKAGLGEEITDSEILGD